MPAPKEDELARLIRWSLQRTIGRQDPPAAAWWRIRDELLAPPVPLYRRFVRYLVAATDLPRLVQGAVTIVLLLFVFTSVLEQPLSPWSTWPSQVTPTADYAPQVYLANGGREGLLSGGYVFQQAHGNLERGYKNVARAGSPEVARLTRVREVTALGFVPVSARHRRVLVNPTEDVLILELSKSALVEAFEERQSRVDPMFTVQAFRFHPGAIPSWTLFD